MTLTFVAPLMLLLAASPEGGGGWKETARTDGIIVHFREPQGDAAGELKASGLIDAPPDRVWKAVRDYANYDKHMPYTQESRILSRSEGDKTILFYSVIAAPFVSKRDYIIELRDESEWADGKGFLKVSWKAVDGPVKPRDGYVRVKLNTGYWRLEPREGGTKTHATYYLHTDPGDSMPRWIVNRANSMAVPDVFRAVRKVATGKQ